MNGDTWPLLSRVAGSLYWMARYIERAENVARVIEVNLHLQLDLPSTAANLWQPLIDASGDTAVFRDKYGSATQGKVIRFLAQDAANSNSIFTCLRAARENARSVRETISSEMWEQVNSMYLQMEGQWSKIESRSLHETFRGIRLASHMFQGITDATMSHNEAWHFANLGRQMERADKTSRILDVNYFMLRPSASGAGTPYEDLHWAAVLKSVSGFEMYRKKHGRIASRSVVEFLVLDREFPRSIHRSISRADDCLRAITGTPAGSFQYSSEERFETLKADLDSTTVDRIIQCGMHDYLDGLQLKMNTLDDALLADFFATSAMFQTAGAAAVY